MDEEAAAVDVAEEVVAEAGALAGALDDAGDVRHHEADALLHPDDAEIGVEGGEVVVRDLGLGLGDHAEEGGLAHVGEADEAHVRKELQLQDDIVALAGEARLGEAGDLAGGGGEMHIAPAAPASLTEDVGLGGGHILDDLAGLGVPHQGAPGDPDHEVLAVLAGFPGALAVHAVGGHVFALVAEVHQGGHVVIHLQDDAAAPAAVAAVRAAGGHVFLPVEGHDAVTAVAGLHGDPGLVDERACHIRILTVLR